MPQDPKNQWQQGSHKESLLLEHHKKDPEAHWNHEQTLKGSRDIAQVPLINEEGQYVASQTIDDCQAPGQGCWVVAILLPGHQTGMVSQITINLSIY